MQLPSSIFSQFYNEARFWIALGGSLWVVYRAIDWFKTIKTNDLAHIQAGVNEVKTSLDEQTSAIVTELKELRQDLRSYYPMQYGQTRIKTTTAATSRKRKS